jgi:hypothetical protein
VFAPVLGYVFTSESDEFPGLFGVFGVGHHGVGRAVSGRLDRLEPGDKPIRFAFLPAVGLQLLNIAARRRA